MTAPVPHEVRPRVLVIETGATVEELGADRFDLAFYAETGRRTTVAEMVNAIPELRSIADIETMQYRWTDTFSLSEGQWIELARLIETHLADSTADGVVIVHGTNTLEETAFFLHATLRSDKPVVVTGALRPASALSADGELNLVNAVRVAAARPYPGQPVLVVLDDVLHGAVEVTKATTHRTGAFKARDWGPLGIILPDGRIDLRRRDAWADDREPLVDLERLDTIPRVDIVMSYVGADGRIIDALVESGAQGIVCAATGGGRMTPEQESAGHRAIEAGVAFCIASRVAAGHVILAPKVAAAGFVAAGALSPWKARIALALGLTATREPAELSRLLARF